MSKRYLAVAGAAVLSLMLAACGSSSGGTTSSTPAASGGSSSAPASSSAAGGGAKVGVILPDTASSARWANNDAPLLGDAFKAAGVESDIQNAGGDKTKFASL